MCARCAVPCRTCSNFSSERWPRADGTSHGSQKPAGPISPLLHAGSPRIPVGNLSQSDGGPLFRALRAWLKVRDIHVRRHPERCGDRLLLTLAGYPLTAEGGTTVVKRLGAAAGVEGVIPHRFRHLFATQYLVAHPGDEIGLRRILGHLSHEILAVYVHLSQAAMAERMSTVSLSSGWLQSR